MDEQKYSTLLEALAEVEDKRAARGKRHPWQLILALLAAALASGQHSGRAIGQWVREQTEVLVAQLQPPRGQLPSEATLRRALQQLDLSQLEAQVAAYSQTLAAQEPAAQALVDEQGVALQGVAVDGKVVRGVKRYGAKLELVSVVRHHSGIVLAQANIPSDSSEQPAVRALLATCDLHAKVVTLDALHTQAALAQQILAQGGHYLMIVKGNQPTLYQEIKLLFERPPWNGDGYQHELQTAHTVNKRHGRLEMRTLSTSTALQGYLDWPGAQQVLCRHCRRINTKTGQISDKTTFAITSLPRHLAGAEQLEALWRAHWTIENRVHYVRDVTFHEDASRVRVGHAQQALAALRNAILNLCRAQGWRFIPDALRHYGAAPHRALRLIGAL